MTTKDITKLLIPCTMLILVKLAGMLVQTNQNLIKISDGISKAFPSRQSYDFIFMFILILAAVTIFLSVKIMHARVDKISVSKQQEHENN
jgi:fucose permease